MNDHYVSNVDNLPTAHAISQPAQYIVYESYYSLPQGGPIIIPGKDQNGSKDIQVGVSSWGVGCANRDFPGVYSRVSSQYRWIKNKVCRKSRDPPASFDCNHRRRWKDDYGNRFANSDPILSVAPIDL